MTSAWGKERSGKVKHPNHCPTSYECSLQFQAQVYARLSIRFNTNSENKPSKIKASVATEKQEGNKNKCRKKEKHANPKGIDILTFPQTVIRGQAHCWTVVLPWLQDNPWKWQNPAGGLMNLGLILKHAGDVRLQRPVLQEASSPSLTANRGHLLFAEDWLALLF